MGHVNFIEKFNLKINHFVKSKATFQNFISFFGIMGNNKEL